MLNEHETIEAVLRLEMLQRQHGLATREALLGRLRDRGFGATRHSVRKAMKGEVPPSWLPLLRALEIYDGDDVKGFVRKKMYRELRRLQYFWTYQDVAEALRAHGITSPETALTRATSRKKQGPLKIWLFLDQLEPWLRENRPRG